MTGNPEESNEPDFGQFGRHDLSYRWFSLLAESLGP
jgi:hypothetical protein